MLRPSSTSGTRPSVAVTSTSHASASSRIFTKKKEYDTVAALEQNADALRETFTFFRKQLKLAEEGADSIGAVLANWPHMFGIIANFAEVHGTALQNLEGDFDEPSSEDQAPSRLVRIPIDEIASDSDGSR